MVKSRDSIDSIDSKFEKLTKDYDSNVKQYGKVQRGHYPLKYVKVESDGTCVISEWNQPKYTKRKKNFFSSNTTIKNRDEKSSEQNFDREDKDDNLENQRYREDREREDRKNRNEGVMREDTAIGDRDQKPVDQETNREATD